MNTFLETINEQEQDKKLVPSLTTSRQEKHHFWSINLVPFLKPLSCLKRNPYQDREGYAKRHIKNGGKTVSENNIKKLLEVREILDSIDNYLMKKYAYSETLSEQEMIDLGKTNYEALSLITEVIAEEQKQEKTK